MPNKTLLSGLCALACAAAIESAFAQDPAPSPEQTPAPEASPAAASSPAPETAGIPMETPASTENADAMSSPEPAAESAPAATDESTLFPEPGSIVPPEDSLLPEMPAQDSRVKTSKTSAANDEMRQRIRFRQAKTRAVNDPKIAAQWERVEAAQTFPEERAELKIYYTALYDRMLKIDGSLAAQVEISRKQSLNLISQEPHQPEEKPAKKAGKKKKKAKAGDEPGEAEEAR